MTVAELLQRSEAICGDVALEDWFGRIASRFLARSRLLVVGKPYRIVEIEFYYHSADHPDPFAHRQPLQLLQGRWYAHRTGGTYRNGSFKGLDVTFGDGSAHGGILIRGLEAPDGSLIDGPSLCVDALLTAMGHSDVGALDRAIGEHLAWGPLNPLRLIDHALVEPSPAIVRSARVGLSLKRSRGRFEMTQFLLRPYRYLSEPRRTAKGKLHMVLAMHAQRIDVETIHRLTGCPRGTIARYIADFEVGRRANDYAPYFGIDWKPQDLCRLHGVWHAQQG